jgi:hypothetical protein
MALSWVAEVGDPPVATHEGSSHHRPRSSHVLIPSPRDLTDGLDLRTGRAFPSERPVGDLDDGWWAVDCVELGGSGRDEPVRIFDAVGPVPSALDGIETWRSGAGTVGNMLIHVAGGQVVEVGKIA